MPELGPAFAAALLVGVAVTAHNNSRLCMATFDNVSLPGWPNLLPPPAPSALMAAAGTGRVDLAWPAATNAVSYNVKRATLNGGPYVFLANVTATNYTDTDLTNGTTYYYVVSATNGFGEGAERVRARLSQRALHRLTHYILQTSS